MAFFSASRRRLRSLGRLRRIVAILARNGFAELAERMNLRRLIPFGKKLLPAAERVPTAERAAEALQELGPTFVKLGQMLSTRPDIVPEDFVRAFTKLQDHVRPFPPEQAREVIEQALGSPAQACFAELAADPMASGSIAQVHAARLDDGRSVVVKIRRPGIDREMKADLELIRELAALAERHVPEFRVYRPVEVAEEFARSLTRELDFSAEAASTAKFASLFRDDMCVGVPEVVWSHTKGNVLTLTCVSGMPLSDVESLERKGVDRKRLAGVIADCFLRQFFEYGVFHADPHPGNLVALEGQRLGLLDFGAVGHLTSEMMTELAAALYAVSAGDISMVAAVYEEIGVIGDSTDRGALLADFQDLFDRYYGMPSSRVDIRRLFGEVTGLARRHNARLPRELVILGRALVTALSVVQRLDPEVKLSEIIRPYIRRLMVNRLAPTELARSGLHTGYSLVTLLRHLPEDLRSIVRKLRRGELRAAFKHEGLEEFTAELDRASNRLAFSVVIAAIIIGSSFIMSNDVGPTWSALGVLGMEKVPLLGLVGFLFAGILGLGLAWSIYRSGKLKG